MKQLSDTDIEGMIGVASDFLATTESVGAIKKSLKLSRLMQSDAPPRVIDCHEKTEEAAFAEIQAGIGRMERFLSLQHRPRGLDAEILVITGKSGVIKRNFHTAITDGCLAGRIKSWTMSNVGCYKIRIRKPTA